MRRVIFLGLAALAISLHVQGSAAKPATPAPLPVAPSPKECVVAPRPIERVAAILATPVASPAGATPVPSATASGEPADEQTSLAVTDTLRQVFACTNAGDYLGVYSLFSDRFLREFFAGTPLTAEVAAFLSAPPQPLPAEQQRIIRALGPVYLLPDGRAQIRIILDEPDDPRTEEPDDVFLIEQEGRWLVDEIHEH
ncbi:MAG: hypothetical protein U0031_21495 [Thermomicrobiales bacterium]